MPIPKRLRFAGLSHHHANITPAMSNATVHVRVLDATKTPRHVAHTRSSMKRNFFATTSRTCEQSHVACIEASTAFTHAPVTMKVGTPATVMGAHSRSCWLVWAWLTHALTLGRWQGTRLAGLPIARLTNWSSTPRRETHPKHRLLSVTNHECAPSPVP